MKKILTFIAIALSTVSFSQNVVVSIENLKANNVTVSNGSPIDIGTDSSVNVTFRVDLEKLASYTIGPAQVWISVFDSSGNRTDHDIATVPESEFITGVSKDYDFDILDSEINFGNGNYFSAVLKQDNHPGAEWESQHIPIIKAPAFELSPSSLSLDCGDTSQKTFTVTNSSNLNGVAYDWNVGNGWSGNVGNGSSITLSPTDGTVLPSDVSVTPIYNGENQQTLTCNVYRTSFTTSATIIGNDALCSTTTANYSVNNLPIGLNVISWSTSNNNVAVINNQGLLTVLQEGQSITVYAVIENSCEQQKTLQKTVWTGGLPSIKTEFNPISPNQVEVSLVGSGGTNINEQGITDTTWEVLDHYGGSCHASFGGSGFFGFGQGNCTNWEADIKITATNACGSTTIYRTVTPPAPDPCKDGFRLAKNPIKPGSETNKIIIDPCDNGSISQSMKKEKYSISIYNVYGREVYEKSQLEKTFDIGQLQKGMYIVKMSSQNGNIVTKKLIVE